MEGQSYTDRCHEFSRRRCSWGRIHFEKLDGEILSDDAAIRVVEHEQLARLQKKVLRRKVAQGRCALYRATGWSE